MGVFGLAPWTGQIEAPDLRGDAARKALFRYEQFAFQQTSGHCRAVQLYKTAVFATPAVVNSASCQLRVLRDRWLCHHKRGRGLALQNRTDIVEGKHAHD